MWVPFLYSLLSSWKVPGCRQIQLAQRRKQASSAWLKWEWHWVCPVTSHACVHGIKISAFKPHNQAMSRTLPPSSQIQEHLFLHMLTSLKLRWGSQHSHSVSRSPVARWQVGDSHLHLNFVMAIVHFCWDLWTVGATHAGSPCPADDTNSARNLQLSPLRSGSQRAAGLLSALNTGSAEVLWVSHLIAAFQGGSPLTQWLRTWEGPSKPPRLPRVNGAFREAPRLPTVAATPWREPLAPTLITWGKALGSQSFP